MSNNSTDLMKVVKVAQEVTKLAMSPEMLKAALRRAGINPSMQMAVGDSFAVRSTMDDHVAKFGDVRTACGNAEIAALLNGQLKKAIGQVYPDTVGQDAMESKTDGAAIRLLHQLVRPDLYRGQAEAVCNM